MYIGSAGQAAGRKAGRADGRVEGAFWSASTDFYCKNEKRVPKRCNIDYFFIVVDKKHFVFLSFRIRRERKYRFLIAKMKNTSNTDATSIGFLTFQIRRSRKYRFLVFKNQFLGTSGNPADPPEMEHELRLATHQQRAGGQDDGSLNKLPQIIAARAPCDVFDHWVRWERGQVGI